MRRRRWPICDHVGRYPDCSVIVGCNGHFSLYAGPFVAQLAAKFFVFPKRVRSSGNKGVEEALF
jgi:hypothetical protein